MRLSSRASRCCGSSCVAAHIPFRRRFGTELRSDPRSESASNIRNSTSAPSSVASAGAVPSAYGRHDLALPPPPLGRLRLSAKSFVAGKSDSLGELNRLASLGETQAARDLFDGIEGSIPLERQTVFCNTVLKAYAKAGDHEGAVAWFESMTLKGMRTNVKTFGKLLESAANAGDIAGAERWLIQRLGSRRQLRRKQSAASEDTLQQVGPKKVAGVDDGAHEADVTLKSCIMVIAASSRAGEAKRVAAWLQRVCSTGLDAETNEGLHGFVVDALARCGDGEAAERWFRDAQVEDSSLAARGTMTALISACGRAGDWAGALYWLSESMQAASRQSASSSHEASLGQAADDDSDRQAHLDKISYTALADAFAKSGDVVGAAGLLTEMEEARIAPNVISFNTVLDACAQRGNTAQASRWLGNMLKMGVLPNTFTYNTIISSCARRRAPAEAAEWLDSMINIGLLPDNISFNSVIDAFAKCGDTSGAAWYLQHMSRVGLAPDEFSYTAMVNSFARRGDVVSAARWLQTMRDEQVTPQVATYNAVITGCASQGDVSGAQRWLDEMSKAKVHPDIISHNSIVDSYAKARDPEGAMNWLDKMEAARHVPNTITFNTVVNACARVGDADRVAEVLVRMTSANLQPNVVTWTSMLAACANATPRRIEAAERVFRQMLECGITPNRLTLRALGRAVGGQRRAELLAELGLREVTNGPSVP